MKTGKSAEIAGQNEYTWSPSRVGFRRFGNFLKAHGRGKQFGGARSFHSIREWCKLRMLWQFKSLEAKFSLWRENMEGAQYIICAHVRSENTIFRLLFVLLGLVTRSSLEG